MVRCLFPPRVWAVCPNVSWGLLPWEADLLAVSKNERIHEIEIKTDINDLRRDHLKLKWSAQFCGKTMKNYIHAYWLAVPVDFLFEAAAMAKAIGGGVIVCETKDGIIYARKEIWPKKWSGPTEKNITALEFMG